MRKLQIGTLLMRKGFGQTCENEEGDKKLRNKIFKEYLSRIDKTAMHKLIYRL